LPGYLFDSSALSNFYHVELGIAGVESIILSEENEIRISRLSVTELASAFAIKVRTKVLTQDDAQLLKRAASPPRDKRYNARVEVRPWMPLGTHCCFLL